MALRLSAVPSVAVEILRLFIVVLGAGIGYGLATQLQTTPGERILGEFTAPWLGAIIGAGLGYSLGGVLARGTLTAIQRTDTALDRLTPDEVVAGGIGAVGGGILGAVLALPALLLPIQLAVPVFGFVVVTGLLLGFRVGQRRRAAILERTSGVTGVATRAGDPRSAVVLVDTSVAIDGRILDIVKAGFLQGRYLLIQPVIEELQGLADAGDPGIRARGRRGLDVLDEFRRLPGVEVEVLTDPAPSIPDVDGKLVRCALERSCSLLTFDTGLAKAAALAGASTQNLHALALALRPPVAVGDEFAVLLSKHGKERHQAVGYLDDGTMVVAEDCAHRIGQEIAVTATSVLVTANGRMIFARPSGSGAH